MAKEDLEFFLERASKVYKKRTLLKEKSDPASFDNLFEIISILADQFDKGKPINLEKLSETIQAIRDEEPSENCIEFGNFLGCTCQMLDLSGRRCACH